MKDKKITMISDAGIVGAGGAGFPSHVKFAASADIVIANGAECEPLLECDRHLLFGFAEEVLQGMKEGMALVGAQQGILAIKEKHEDLISHLTPFVDRVDGILLKLLPDVYPMGDEQVLVHQVTARLVPPGEIPLVSGCVVSNVMTFYNIYEALRGIAVTNRNVTVNGLVNKPFTALVPIGTSFGQLIEMAGGYSSDNIRLVAGGPMTGFIVSESDVVTKTTGGILALSSNSHIVKEKEMSMESIHYQSKAACFQCQDCTRVCPRWQLGSPLQPHLIMRAINYNLPFQIDDGEDSDSSIKESLNNDMAEILKTAHYCCECGLCATVGCQTMRLSPRKVCSDLKKHVERPDKFVGDVKKQNIRLEDYQVPSSRLLLRYGLSEFGHTPFVKEPVNPMIVTLLMRQHIGIPSRPLVKVGESVIKGQLIGARSHDGLSAAVHASIDGTVTYVSPEKVVISR